MMTVDVDRIGAPCSYTTDELDRMIEAFQSGTMYTVGELGNKLRCAIGEIERLRAREASARVCGTCGGIGTGQYRSMVEHRVVFKDEPCHKCKGTGIVYDGDS